MFVPGAHARVHIAGIGGPLRRNKNRQKQARRKVGVREILRMPCLLPTILIVFFGLLVLAGGAGMCVLGYVPDTVAQLSDDSNTTTIVMVTKDSRYYATKSLSYAGPVLMGCGFFAIIVSCVLYCEIIDRYAVLMPNKPETRLKRQDVLEMILSEFKKSYFRGIEVPIRKEPQPGPKSGERSMETLLKALSISTPVLLMSPELAPTWRFTHYPYTCRGHPRHFALKPRHPKLKQLGGGGGGSGGGGVGGSGGGGVGGVGSEEHEPWLKTSSLPNICDPELRRQAASDVLPRSVILDQPLEAGRARRLRRFGRPSRSMDSRMSCSLPQSLSQSSSGVDNPAYLHEHDRKRSLSMCVHAPTPRRLPARFLKTSHLQPRVRLQQLQLQQIQKQQQQLLQQHHKQQQQQAQPQQQQKKKLARRQSSHDSGSDESSGRRRCGSVEGRPTRHRPKLVQTRGNHQTFDCGVDSPTSRHSDPPPFPLPAHFMLAKKHQDSAPAVSPRTAKLLKAKCQSLDIRDRKKTDVILLRDLFRPADVQDSPFPPSQGSLSSLPCTISQERAYTEPLGGHRCENVAVTVHAQDKTISTSNKPQLGTKDSAFVRVTPSRPECANDSVDYSVDLSNICELDRLSSDSDEQRYELPLLSGVTGTNRQWEVERRRKIQTDFKLEEMSHSGKPKHLKPSPKLEVATVDLNRSHSSGSSRDHESRANHNKADTSASKNFQVKDRRMSSQSRKSRPKSWNGSPSHRANIPDRCEPPKSPSLAFNQLERDSHADLMTPQISSCDVKETKQGTSAGLEFTSSDSSYPCRMVLESEIQVGKTSSKVLTPEASESTNLLNYAAPLHVSQTPTERSPVPLHHHHQCQQQQQRLVVPAQVHSQDQSPTQGDPSFQAGQSRHESLQSQHCNEQSCPEDPSLGKPSREVQNVEEQESECQSKTDTPCNGQGNGNGVDSEFSEQSVDKQCQGDEPCNALNRPLPQQNPQKRDEQQTQQQQQRKQEPQNRETCKHRPTVIHQASVHLSLDSFPDSSMSMTSSTISSTDNTNSSHIPLLPPSPTIPPHSGFSAGGEGGSGGRKDGDRASHALRRMRYTQSRSVAVEELSPDEDQTEDTPLIQHSLDTAPHSARRDGNS